MRLCYLYVRKRRSVTEPFCVRKGINYRLCVIKRPYNANTCLKRNVCVMRICIIREYKKYFSHAHVYASLSESQNPEPISKTQIRFFDFDQPCHGQSGDQCRYQNQIQTGARNAVTVSLYRIKARSDQTRQAHSKRSEQTSNGTGNDQNRNRNRIRKRSDQTSRGTEKRQAYSRWNRKRHKTIPVYKTSPDKQKRL